MAQIKVNDLCVTGSDLFSDSESYLDELSNDAEMSNVKGGTLIIYVGVTLVETYIINKLV